jgi:hypothetical protein
MTTANPLYRLHELAIRTLYSEVKERANAIGDLLPGTPGTLVKRAGTGHEYWYRSYYPLPKKRSEDYVGPVSNEAAYQAMQDRIAHSEWTAKQVSALSKLGYQVAEKGVASVLVELHNRKIFEAGLVVVGSLAYMSWLNEYGAVATAARTQDIDLARRQRLKLATTVPFLASVQATQLPFVAVPELEWHAQTIPFYDYLLEGSRPAAMLAGGHCVPIMLPEVTRMIWHKLYASTQRAGDPTKAEKDLVQAATLAAILIEQDGVSLRETFRRAPRELRTAVTSRLPRIETLLAAHPQAVDGFREL